MIEKLPTTSAVANSLLDFFSQEEIDLRDITSIALQDPIVLANIILLVNKLFSERGRPVVNTVQAAINLVGLPVLKERLLSIENVENKDISDKQLYSYNLIRNRIYIAANITSFWADYMGEKNIEEQYCASMFTGLNALYQVVCEGAFLDQVSQLQVHESIDKLQDMYSFNDKDIQRLPDSIQQVLTHSVCAKRLNLSVLTYELITALELGYSSEEFNQSLQLVIELIDQSASRACYDLATQIVSLHKNMSNLSFNHASFLVSTNCQAVDPLNYIQ